MRENRSGIRVFDGDTLLALSNRAVYHSSDVKVYGKYGEIYKDFEDNIADSKILSGNLPKRTSVGELCDDYGNDYLFVLNRDFEKELCADISLSGSFNIYEVSREDGKQGLVSENVDKISVSLAPGDAVLFRVQPADEEKFIAEYKISE